MIDFDLQHGETPFQLSRGLQSTILRHELCLYLAIYNQMRSHWLEGRWSPCTLVQDQAFALCAWVGAWGNSVSITDKSGKRSLGRAAGSQP